MKNVLLLGPGKSRHRIHGGAYFGSIPNELISIADRSESILADWAEVAHRFNVDLRYPPFPFPPSHYDEIHAYEVLNLLPGDEIDFFYLWQALWETLKPGGRVFATVPHYASEWVHAYPAPQRTYTPGLLSYLDHGPAPGRGMEISAKEDFDDRWPLPYNFVLESSRDVGSPPEGYFFTLAKR